MLKRIGWLLGIVATCAALPLQAQTRPANADSSTEEGIPIQSELVRSRCGSCHKVDDKMRMSRISYRRASPENWEKTIKRMVSLNHVNLDPADARNILKYLADHNGLAPEDVRPIAFEAEHRLVEYTYTADKDTSDTCSSCHTIARVMSERRTKEEWGLLVDMHRGYYPLVDNQPMNGGQGFRRTRPAQTEPAPTVVRPTTVIRWRRRSSISRRRIRSTRRRGRRGRPRCSRRSWQDAGPSQDTNRGRARLSVRSSFPPTRTLPTVSTSTRAIPWHAREPWCRGPGKPSSTPDSSGADGEACPGATTSGAK